MTLGSVDTGLLSWLGVYILHSSLQFCFLSPSLFTVNQRYNCTHIKNYDMETFWSTAWRYAKGESGLPSVLPEQGSGGKSRRVRLFCKGLEQFREILYVELSLDEISGTDLFQSLFTTEKTPPTSPSNASSSSTLVDPSSRRVSPSDAMVGAEATSTAVADVANPSLNGNDVSDSVLSIDKLPKLELLRQLEEMTAEEERFCRKAKKHAARSKQLSAEIAALKG